MIVEIDNKWYKTLNNKEETMAHLQLCQKLHIISLPRIALFNGSQHPVYLIHDKNELAKLNTKKALQNLSISTLSNTIKQKIEHKNLVIIESISDCTRKVNAYQFCDYCNNETRHVSMTEKTICKSCGAINMFEIKNTIIC